MKSRLDPRNTRFYDHQPFADNSLLSLITAAGPIGFFNPTSTQFNLSKRQKTHQKATVDSPQSSNASGNDEKSQVDSTHPEVPEGTDNLRKELESQGYETTILWRSRDNRKGRHALLVRRRSPQNESETCWIDKTNSFAATCRGIRRMFTLFPYRDISWLISVILTLAACVWVANGFIGLLPVIPGREQNKREHGCAWTAFAGAFITLIGSVLLVLEALNADQRGCLGWDFDYDDDEGCPVGAHPSQCQHHHTHKRGHKPSQDKSNTKEDAIDVEKGATITIEPADYGLPWKWLPSWSALSSHYIYEIGFISSVIQLISIIIFWLCKFLTIPEVLKHLSIATMNGAYWAPEIVACVGFIVTCILTMVETQRRWYIPAPSVLGWHIGLWKLIGSIGFTVCTSLGPMSQDSSYYQFHSNLASFWGSWAFLIGGLLQWYESLDKNPVIFEGTHFYSEWSKNWNREVVELEA